MNPKDIYADLGLGLSVKSTVMTDLFKKLVLDDLASWTGMAETVNHTCGCGYPNASPPCWHCTDCTDCAECEYCDEDHAGPEECPALTNPIAYFNKEKS